MSPGPATALLAAVATAAFLIDRIWALAVLTLILLVLCLRAPVERRWLYIGGALFSALTVIVISPLTWSSGGGTLIWEGPTLPVIGPVDLSTDEIRIAVVSGLRLAVVGLAFSAYTLLVDHDRLVSAAGFARTIGARRRTRHPPRPQPRAGRGGALGVGARSRGRVARRAGLRDAALAARRRVARAGDRPRGGDGGAWVRAQRGDPRTAAGLDVDRPDGARRSGRARRGGGRVALASVDGLSFAYPGGGPGVRDVSLELEAGEIVALLGPSGSGKSTLLRALAGLVPHFHGGRFSGRVEVAGLDTRSHGPAELAGVVASVFQDPEDQVVMTRVENEVAFGLENLGVAPNQIWPRTHAALAEVGAAHLAERRTVELSGGELQRVCLASALALEPQLLLLDEPTSQLDATGAEAFLSAVEQARCAVVLSEQRVDRALAIADRVIMMEEGRIVLDAPIAEARAWLAHWRPRYAGGLTAHDPAPATPDRGAARRPR